MRESCSFILWSGGKDSYLSYKKAVARGFRVKYALSYVDERSKRLIGCYIRESVVRRQAELLGLEFVPVYGSKRKGNFLMRLSDILGKLGVRYGILGDLVRNEHRSLVEGVCRKLGIRAVFPLWHVSEEKLMEDILGLCTPVVVCRRVRLVRRHFLGRPVDREFIAYLRSKGLSLSGEGGEYQSFVKECEEFNLSIEVLRSFRRSYYECIDFEVE